VVWCALIKPQNPHLLLFWSINPKIEAHPQAVYMPFTFSRYQLPVTTAFSVTITF
jgi:hypothetical protein